MKRTRTNDVSQDQTKRSKGYTLIQAMRTDDVEACKRMIANGGQVDNTPTKKAMMDCIEMGCVHVCTYMAQHMFMLDMDDRFTRFGPIRYDWANVYLFIALEHGHLDIADAFLEHKECSLEGHCMGTYGPVATHPLLKDTTLKWHIFGSETPLNHFADDEKVCAFIASRLGPESESGNVLFELVMRGARQFDYYHYSPKKATHQLRTVQCFLDCGYVPKANASHNPAVANLIVPYTPACTTFIDHLKIDKILHENDAHIPLDIINLIHEYNGAPLRPLKNARELYL
jgi:hypothetical protein